MRNDITFSEGQTVGRLRGSGCPVVLDWLPRSGFLSNYLTSFLAFPRLMFVLPHPISFLNILGLCLCSSPIQTLFSPYFPGPVSSPFYGHPFGSSCTALASQFCFIIQFLLRVPLVKGIPLPFSPSPGCQLGRLPKVTKMLSLLPTLMCSFGRMMSVTPQLD